MPLHRRQLRCSTAPSASTASTWSARSNCGLNLFVREKVFRHPKLELGTLAGGKVEARVEALPGYLSRVEIETMDGKVVHGTAKPFPGDPKAPFSDAQLEQAPRQCRAGCGDGHRSHRRRLEHNRADGQCCRVHVASGVRFRGGAEKRGRRPGAATGNRDVRQPAERLAARGAPPAVSLTPLGASILRLMISMN